MQLWLILGMFCVTCAFCGASRVEEWNHFKVKYNKTYSSKQEESKRMKIFLENMKDIEQHNRKYESGLVSFSKGLNSFADMTALEFKNLKSAGFSFPKGSQRPLTTSNSYTPDNRLNLPRSFDWRDNGAVTPVRNQQLCLACWIFSAVGAVESHHFIQTGELVQLSIQNVADCIGVAEDGQDCPIGWMDQAFEYIKDNGINTEESYPYEAKVGTCRFDKNAVVANISGYTDLPAGNEKQLRLAVATIGPVSIAIDCLDDFKFYKSGIFYSEECKNAEEDLNHALLIVGYGSEGGQAFWLVKNSWGTSWGEEGYGKIARNKGNHCGIATKASYPIIDKPEE